VLDLAAYEALRQVPDGRPVMAQRWRSLTFLHFACDPAEIQSLLPAGLTVDTFDGRAWVGLVPFRMEGVRPLPFPAVPSLSDFPETNVRTYVHREGEEPGVWFFSLDAANGLACRIARRFFALPYFEARMTVDESSSTVRYWSERRDEPATLELETELGPEIGLAEPGSLEFFLVERYLLYARRGDRLMTGRVHHAPYGLRTATVRSIKETMVGAAGMSPRPFEHVLFSSGVDVLVWPLG